MAKQHHDGAAFGADQRIYCFEFLVFTIIPAAFEIQWSKFGPFTLLGNNIDALDALDMFANFGKTSENIQISAKFTCPVTMAAIIEPWKLRVALFDWAET